MATYYVDLARAGSGHAGTIIDQFTQAEFINVVHLGNNNIFYVKGIGPLIGNISFWINVNNSVLPQIQSPWRIRSTGTLEFISANGTNSNFSGGIIYADIKCLFSRVNLKKCLIQTPSVDLGDNNYNNFSASILGCHIVSTNLTLGKSIITVLDSCISAINVSQNPTPGNSSFTADYCAFSDTAAHLVADGGDPVNTVVLGAHNQYSWTCPAMPLITANASEFTAAALSVGVATPPQPGSAPYTDTDPWGNARTGIGFGWFRASTPRRMLFGSDGINLGALDPYEDGNWRIVNPRLYDNQEFIAFEWYDRFDGVWTPQTRIAKSASVAITQSGAPSLVGIDVSGGHEVYTLTLTENAELSNPVGQYRDGQSIIIRVTQGGAGSYLLTYDTKFAFSAGLPTPTLSTTVGARDYLGFRYNSDKDTWDFLAVVTGF
jgi:hypothetical protein